VITAAYLVNRSLSEAIKTDKTQYELWHNQKPKLNFLRVFGCTAYVHNKTRKHKFDKSIKGTNVTFDEVSFKTSRQELDDMIKIDRYLGENTDDLVQDISTEEISVTWSADEKSVKESHPGKTDKEIKMQSNPE
jgi:hypothetical protein